ncbi:MAG: hypothetical protein CL685_02285 [Candidatus Magasanikbacteria bacterium]|nr:hypothetical protein [Candidatus Magasanikbacteria bacterium]|tara:strand:- start:5156 stop:5551 length:396 start_codon:yes stop_codon:yes gene_type:complete
MAKREKNLERFIEIFAFTEDTSKQGRVLESVKVGDVYMSRLRIAPGVTTGNYYYSDTNVLMSVECGAVMMYCENVETKERIEMKVKPGEKLIEIGPKVARATKNIGKKDAILIFFSDKPLRSSTSFSYVVI